MEEDNKNGVVNIIYNLFVPSDFLELVIHNPTNTGNHPQIPLITLSKLEECPHFMDCRINILW